MPPPITTTPAQDVRAYQLRQSKSLIQVATEMGLSEKTCRGAIARGEKLSRRPDSLGRVTPIREPVKPPEVIALKRGIEDLEQLAIEQAELVLRNGEPKDIVAVIKIVIDAKEKKLARTSETKSTVVVNFDDLLERVNERLDKIDRVVDIPTLTESPEGANAPN